MDIFHTFFRPIVLEMLKFSRMSCFRANQDRNFNTCYILFELKMTDNMPQVFKNWTNRLDVQK